MGDDGHRDNKNRFMLVGVFMLFLVGLVIFAIFRTSNVSDTTTSGPGSGVLAVSGGNGSRTFVTPSGSTVTIDDQRTPLPSNWFGNDPTTPAYGDMVGSPGYTVRPYTDRALPSPYTGNPTETTEAYGYVHTATPGPYMPPPYANRPLPPSNSDHPGQTTAAYGDVMTATPGAYTDPPYVNRHAYLNYT